MNIVQIGGHLGADPETRFTASGQKVTTLRVATNSRKAGKDETIWWRVTIWGDRFEKMLPYLKKGSSVIVIGNLNKPDIWTDKEGRPQVSLEIVAEMLMFSPFGKTDRPAQEQASHAPRHQGSDSDGEAAYSMAGGFGGGAQFGGGGQNSHKQADLDDQPPF